MTHPYIQVVIQSKSLNFYYFETRIVWLLIDKFTLTFTYSACCILFKAAMKLDCLLLVLSPIQLLKIGAQNSILPLHLPAVEGRGVLRRLLQETAPQQSASVSHTLCQFFHLQILLILTHQHFHYYQ